jgi:hypothetical protein
MIRIVLAVAMTIFIAIPGPARAVLAQQRVSSSYVEELKNKVETQREAFYRFELAEKEALQEGSVERAAAFREAKAKANEAYHTLNAQLQKVQFEKREQEKRLSEQNPDYR